MSLSDQTLYCRDCNAEFTFTVGEQEFYASRGLTNSPSRCPDCRAARKQSGGGYNSSRSRSSDYREREPRALVIFMTVVIVNPGDSFEFVLKRFKRKVQEAGILSEARRRRHYESPQARRKRKAEAQRRRRRRAR